MNASEFFNDALPADAQGLIDEFEMNSAEIRKVMERECESIREQADAKIAALQTGADDKIRTLTQELLARIKPIQDKYAKDGMLDEALTIRERIRQMRGQAFNVQPDPGHVGGNSEHYGKSFLYEVVGSTDGSVYGTDIYTCDASLAAACVHAGVLAPGEKGIVRVTILPQQHPNFKPSTRNGITSLAWTSAYPAFRVARA
jgi:LCCL domain